MLASLRIQSVAIIDALEIALSPGLNVFTGETGAGKSIVLDALSLVLGERATAEIIRTGADCARVEALFDTGKDARVAHLLAKAGLALEEDGTVLVCREISREGKGRCFVNGRLAPLSVLRELGNLLVDLHGQHEHQRLLDDTHHIELLDAFGDAEFLALRDAVAADIAGLGVVQAALDDLSRSASQIAAELELARFQVQEIDAAKVDLVADAAAEGRLRLLANLERVRREAAQVVSALSAEDDQRPGILAALAEIAPMLEYVVKTQGSGAMAKVEAAFREATFLLQDVASSVERFAQGLELDPDEQRTLEERMDLLHELRRKYGPTLENVVAKRQELHARIDALGGPQGPSRRLEEERAAIVQRLVRHLPDLTRRRRTLARALEGRVARHLKDLAMPAVRFAVDIESEEDPASPVRIDSTPVRLYTEGADRVVFRISPNAGEPLKPLARIASGGEVSRVMLAIKSSLALLARVPIMVFDEIDAGLGGTTAVKVAQKLMQVSRECQCLVITHLPPIASAARAHFAVDKRVEGRRTQVHVRRLSDPDRVKEIQRMLGGEGKATLDHARALLAARRAVPGPDQSVRETSRLAGGAKR